jgi:predicted NAD/FAD-dependent oxidoreductase
LIPRVGLSRLIPEPAVRCLRERGAELRLGCAVRGVELGQRPMLRLRDGSELAASAVVIATGPQAAARLLSDHDTALAERINSLDNSAIATAYLRYREPHGLREPMFGLLSNTTENPGEWVFVRDEYELSVVASAVDARLDRQRWLATVIEQLAMSCDLPRQVDRATTFVERRASFLCTPENNARRPAVGKLDDDLYLAGDYTATGLPATLEGAVRSGVECALAIIRSQTGTDR